MAGRTTASAVLKLMTPAHREALLEYAFDRWESEAQDGTLGETCTRLGINRDDLSEGCGLISREWNGMAR
jgi:hypothetical protein